MKQQAHNDHVGQKKCPVVDTWWQWFPGGIGCSSWHLLHTKPVQSSD
jgi:hypothetical protein